MTPIQINSSINGNRLNVPNQSVNTATDQTLYADDTAVEYRDKNDILRKLQNIN